MTLDKAGQRRDEDIKLDVVANLRWDGRVDAADVQVDVDGGRVTLSGTVPNHTARVAAVQETWFTAGVGAVDDELKVVLKKNVPGGSDEELAARANDIIDWHSDLDGCDVRVSVKEGAARLEGTVDAHWKINRVHRLVMGIRGITEVNNNLAVVPSHSVADEALAEDITAALARNVLVGEDQVEVEVANGVVTLKGSVASWMEAHTVKEVVSATPGALEVRDQLERSMGGNRT
jgi:hyperosmotically inducible periplasmic protein